ncbi:hypothetical protein ACVI1J_008988 [Bradyrhizobium diazoefficiens]
MLPIERKLLARAIEGMSVQFPVYLDEVVLERLMSDDVPDQVLLGALVEMTDRCYDRYENGPIKDNDSVDVLAQSAGEHAIRALAHFCLMTRVDARRGRWTAEGKAFLAEGQKEWNEWKDQLEATMEARRHEGQIGAFRERQEREIQWARYALMAAAIATGAIMAGSLALLSFRLF